MVSACVIVAMKRSSPYSMSICTFGIPNHLPRKLSKIKLTLPVPYRPTPSRILKQIRPPGTSPIIMAFLSLKLPRSIGTCHVSHSCRRTSDERSRDAGKIPDLPHKLIASLNAIQRIYSNIIKRKLKI